MKRHSKLSMKRMISTIMGRIHKRQERKLDWYKSKHKTSDYLGGSLMKNRKVVKRWDIEASK